MTITKTASLAAALASLLMLSACANTIRGVGQDAANTVDAAESAGRNVANAAD